jgi:hypothetical protein
MILLLYAILLSSVPFEVSQTDGIVKGFVFDAVTKKPLHLANIIVKETPYGAAADSNGYFEIKGIPPGIYAVEFTHVGYKTKLRVINLTGIDDIELEIGLDQESISLPEIMVIDSSEYLRSIHRYPGSTVITPSMIKKLGDDARLNDILREYVPRLDLEIVRWESGRRPLRLMLMIDGRKFPIYEPREIYDYVEAKEISSVVVHRGMNAMLLSGSRSPIDWLIEIIRQKYLEGK